MARGAWGYTLTDKVWKWQVTMLPVSATLRAASEWLKKSVQQHERVISLAMGRGPKGTGAPMLSSVKKKEVLPRSHGKDVLQSARQRRGRIGNSLGAS